MGKSVAINIQGTIYRNLGQFLKHHGFSRHQFDKALRYEDGKERYILAAKRLLEIKSKETKKLKKTEIPVNIWGRLFNSIAEACRYFKISEKEVGNDYKKGIQPEESIINHIGVNQKIFEAQQKKIQLLDQFLYQMKQLDLE